MAVLDKPTMTRPRVQPRPSAPVRRRRRRRLVRLLLLVLMLALVGTGVWVLAFSSVLATRHTVVSDVSVLSKAEVRQSAAVPIGLPLARQDLDAIAARVAALPPVESVEVARQWPDTVVVTVTERTPVITVKRSDGYLLVDRHGIGFQTVTRQPDDMVLAQVDPGNGPLLIDVAAVAGAMPAGLRAQVASIKAVTPSSITVQISGGPTVVWGTAAQSDVKSQVLAALLEMKGKPRQIDVSSPHNPAVR